MALIGIISVFFVLRHKSVEKRSMYSSRRSNLERKVKAARQRTLAPRGRGGKAPTEAEIAATPMTAAPAYQAPATQTQSWDMPAAPAPVYEPPPPAPVPVYEPPPAAPSAPVEPSTPTPSQPEWTPAPAEAVWTPAPSADIPRAREPEPVAAQPVVPAGEGAAWSIVGDARPGDDTQDKDKEKDKGKKKVKAAAGNAWELSSGEAPGEEEDDEPKKPSAAMALAQYAVLVVGLVMVANSKVT